MRDHSSTELQDFPPTSNTGGKPPASQDLNDCLATKNHQSSLVVVDTLTFTLRGGNELYEGCSVDDDIRCFFDALLRPYCFALGKHAGGKNGYDCSYILTWEDQTAGFIAAGGNAGTVCVHLNATGSAAMMPFMDHLAENLSSLDAKITRVDLAYDDHEGDKSVAWAIRRYRSGAFTTRKEPKSKLIKPMGSDQSDGQTFYVGDRKNGKLYRCYEKGRQLGDPSSPWVRHEVQLGSRDRIIPYDVLTRPAQFLAGTYPALAFISDAAEKVTTIAHKAAATLEKKVKHARLTVGKLLNYLVDGGLSPAGVLGLLQANVGYPQGLLFPFSSPRDGVSSFFETAPRQIEHLLIPT